MTTRLERLSLRGLRLDCVLGTTDRAQTVELDATLHVDPRASAGSFDRPRLLGELRFVAVTTRFDHLERFVEAAAAWLLLPPSADVPRPPVEAVEVRLARVGAAAPAIALRRERGDFRYATETQSFGLVDIVYETRDCGLYRERIYPRTVLPTHVHHHLDESELVLGDGLLLQGEPVPAGAAHTWPRGFPHRYENRTDIEQSFLCIDRPAFIPTDEVPVDVPLASLRRTEPTRFF